MRLPPSGDVPPAPSASSATRGSGEPAIPWPFGPWLAMMDRRLRRLPPTRALLAILLPFTLVLTAILALGAYVVSTR